MMQLIFDTLWLFLPAIGANMAPVFAARYRWLENLNIPLDRGQSLKGKRILGDNKTLRGLVLGVLTGAIIGFLQSDLAFFGAVMGFGAIAGDAVASFFKRQLTIAPGSSLPVFDQIDFVIGAIIFTWFIVPYTAPQIVVALLVLGTGSYLISYVGVLLSIKKSL